MSAINNNSTSPYYAKDNITSFTLPSKKQPSVQKQYTLDLTTLGKEIDFIGKGVSGSVMRAGFNIQTTDGHSKKKQYALKIFESAEDMGEFTSHQKIIKKIGRCSIILKPLNITPGTGIEKEPVYAFCHNNHKCIVKRLYNMNLNDAIHLGYFNDQNRLLLASKQLLEGMISLMSIGALYFDIKPLNILVGRNSEFEVVFSDFEEVLFRKFNEDDDAIIKKAFIKMPQYLPNILKLFDLQEIQKKEKPAKEFIDKLHKI